ncbi:gluconate 2-dehydrogenase subunit 3 family protein [Lentibacillus sp. N15]|uniref:gluconate 2-dehydrogenase subunit 3 family protein n=1 Tax=Lentibacillus songyuanensis TaxID=3136161 RepID=UPI0031BB93E1
MTDKYSDKDKDSKDKSADKTEEDSHANQEEGISRRRFIRNTGMVAGGVVGGSLLGGFFTNQWQTEPNTKPKEEHAETFQRARTFFSRLEDFAVLEAATECIYPKDDNGPGAIELGVPYFIDKQLAGSWGLNAKDYRQGPFMKFQQVGNQAAKDADEEAPPNPQGAQGQDRKTATENQRNQSRLTRRDIFVEGLRKMNQESKDRFKTTFDKAKEDQQIEILQDFENGKVQMKGVAAENFFILLRQSTLEGAYADPLYGGNKDMLGWKMKEFPGAQPSYTSVIEKDEFAKMKPISLNNYQGHS